MLHICCTIYPQKWSLICVVRRIVANLFEVRKLGLWPISGTWNNHWRRHLLSWSTRKQSFLIALYLKVFNTLRLPHQVKLAIFDLCSQYCAFVFKSQFSRRKLINILETILWLSWLLPLKQQGGLTLHRCYYFAAWRGRACTKSFISCHSAPHHIKLLVAHNTIN